MGGRWRFTSNSCFTFTYRVGDHWGYPITGTHELLLNTLSAIIPAARLISDCYFVLPGDSGFFADSQCRDHPRDPQISDGIMGWVRFIHFLLTHFLLPTSTYLLFVVQDGMDHQIQVWDKFQHTFTVWSSMLWINCSNFRMFTVEGIFNFDIHHPVLQAIRWPHPRPLGDDVKL